MKSTPKSNFLLRIFVRIKERFKIVWRDKYPMKWHIFNIVIGAFCAVLYVVYKDELSIGLRIGLFFGIWPLASLIILAFNYGLVRAKRAWTLKR